MCLLSACNRLDVVPETVSSETTSSEVAVYQKITARQAKEMMDSGKPFVLLDVRTEAEYRESRIDGARLIPDYAISEKAAAALQDKSALILVYCRSGARSATAAHALVRMGYTNVYDFGGLSGWPFETVSGPH